MNTKLKTLKKELNHQHLRLNLTNNILEIDAIIYQMQALELEMMLIIRNEKKMEMKKESCTTPKTFTKLIPKLLYQLKK